MYDSKAANAVKIVILAIIVVLTYEKAFKTEVKFQILFLHSAPNSLHVQQFTYWHKWHQRLISLANL